MKYVETSAKANTQVEEAFFNLARDVKARLIDTATTPAAVPGQGSTGVDVGKGGETKAGGCCA